MIAEDDSSAASLDSSRKTRAMCGNDEPLLHVVTHLIVTSTCHHPVSPLNVTIGLQEHGTAKLPYFLTQQVIVFRADSVYVPLLPQHSILIYRFSGWLILDALALFYLHILLFSDDVFFPLLMARLVF